MPQYDDGNFRQAVWAAYCVCSSGLYRLGRYDADISHRRAVASTGHTRRTWNRSASLCTPGSYIAWSDPELFPMALNRSTSSLDGSYAAKVGRQAPRLGAQRLRLPGTEPLPLLRVLWQHFDRNPVDIRRESLHENIAVPGIRHRLGIVDRFVRA